MLIEDLSMFFADFATACTVGAATTLGIFSTPHELGGLGITGVAATQPTLIVRTASVATDPVGLSATVGAVSYVVAAHEPDGTGISRLLLDRA
jgi:hypothetical protein